MDAAPQAAEVGMDELASRAREAISSIVVALADRPAADITESQAIALALHGLVEAGELDAQEAAARIARERDAIMLAIAESPLPLRLHGGLYGAIWTLARLGEAIDVSEVGALLAAQLHQRIAAGSGVRLRIDLLDGLVGLGVFALDHAPEVIASLVELLELTAISHGEGLVWAKPSAWSLALGWHELPPGHVDLGMAHGVAGVVALLARVVSAGHGDARARRILADAVAGLRSLALRSASGTTYPATVGPDLEARPTRVAWCYGDLGVASSLAAAGRALVDATLEREAIELALAAARREPELAHVESAGMCHGACGLAWMLLRLHQAHGEPELALLSRRWFAHALALREPGRGLAGYLARDEQTGAWVENADLLEGVSGIALALLGVLGHRELRWDRYLLLQPPP